MYPTFIGFSTLLALSSALRIPSKAQTLTSRNPNEKFSKRYDSSSGVSWDNYTLSVLGQRTFLYSGEFHTWRLPVPSLWTDIMQKFKAVGFNGVSIYIHWGLVSPSQPVLDFDGFRQIQPLFDAAREAGVFVTVRPGPYINAETTAGGLPGWITATSDDLRDNSTAYYEAWKPYIESVSNISAANEIGKGGPVILVQVENEYGDNSVTQPYFEALEEVMRASGVTVPLTTNDVGQDDNWATGPGAVDVYGFDNYPLGFDCATPYVWPSSGVPTTYVTYHAKTDPSEPLYIPEFQGGSFDAWGPNAPGYDQCELLVGPEFVSVYYRNIMAQNGKMMSFYMGFGGTSFGQLAFPGVYTSYDYGATIRETRQLAPKADEVKLQGLFVRTVRDFYKTVQVSNSSVTTYTNNSGVYISELRNFDSGSGFYIARQQPSTSTNTTSFTLAATSSSLGSLELGPILLHGRQSKIISLDISFGNSQLLYSTAQVFWAGTMGSKDVLFLYGDLGDSYTTSFLAKSGSTKFSYYGVNSKTISESSDSSLTSPIYSFSITTEGLSAIASEDQIILFSDPVTAASFWNPTIAGEGDLGNFWGIGTNETVLVGGPYLVRTAEISGKKLALTGDLNSTTSLSILAPSTISSVTWNGESLSLKTSEFEALGFLAATLTYDEPDLDLPDLLSLEWKYANSLPEIESSYLDNCWQTADHTYSNSTSQPTAGNVSLDTCEYGFCEGNFLFRGHFNSTGTETGIILSIEGGEAFSASVWLNSDFIGTTYGNSSNDDNIISSTTQTYTFPSGSLVESNVITVLSDHMGQDEWGGTVTDPSPKDLRGILSYELLGSDAPLTWKVQGKLGGYTNFPDTWRGVKNEGGLYAERAGWHLPGFDDSSWESSSPSTGISSPGVAFYRTTFELDFPEGYDVPLSFVLPTPVNGSLANFRTQIYVNGWQMGKYVSYLGPQYKFPVHQGILNYQGTNTLAISLWAQGDSGASIPSFGLEANGIYQGGIENIEINNPSWVDRGTCI